MKSLNDFKNENKDLEKLEMINTQGGLADPKITKTLTVEADSNWNCGDVKTCTRTDLGNGNGIETCVTEALPDGAID